MNNVSELKRAYYVSNIVSTDGANVDPQFVILLNEDHARIKSETDAVNIIKVQYPTWASFQVKMPSTTAVVDGTELTLYVGKYIYANNLYVGALYYDDELEQIAPWADVTVNLGPLCVENGAYLDTNNYPEAEQLVDTLGVATKTQYTGHSGFCEYPLYIFDAEKLKQFPLVG